MTVLFVFGSARTARRVIFARGACTPWAAAFAASVVGVPVRVDGA